MAASAFAHPTVKKLFSLPGVSEASFFWVDDETGIVCKCRPDRYVKSQPIIIDVKTTDKMELFDKSIHDFRYYVQDSFYSEGYRQVMEQNPSFFFLVIGKYKNAGRHPVRIFELGARDKEDGDIEFRANLIALKDAKESGDFKGIQPIKRRFYRKAKD
jgi:exodeoxyribonuclease VIII